MARAEELVDKMKTTRDPNIINKLNQELMAVLDSIKDIVPDEELPDSP